MKYLYSYGIVLIYQQRKSEENQPHMTDFLILSHLVLAILYRRTGVYLPFILAVFVVLLLI